MPEPTPALLDQFGRPFRSDAKPDDKVVAVASIRDRSRRYMANGVDPRKLARILRDADQGNIADQAELFDDMLDRDAHLLSVYGKRTRAVTKLSFEIKPGDDSPRAAVAATFAADVLRQLKPRRLVGHLMTAPGHGFAASEIVWDRRDGDYIPRQLIHVEQRQFRWDWSEERLLYIGGGATLGLPLAANKWIVSHYTGKSGHAARAGIFRPCAWLYMFKNFSLKDWLAFLEVFGMPLRLGKYPRNANAEEKASLEAAIVGLASDSAGIVPEGSEIEFIFSEASARAELWDRFVQRQEDGMSKVVLGETLTTEASTRGTQALGTVHKEVGHDLQEADAFETDEVINTDLIRPLHLFNFGPNVPQPIYHTNAELPEDRKVEADIRNKDADTKIRVLQATGLPTSRNKLRQQFDLPEPENEADALTVGPANGGGEGNLVAASAVLGAAFRNRRELAAQSTSGEASDWIEEMAATMERAGGKVAAAAFRKALKSLPASGDAEDILMSLGETLAGLDPKVLEEAAARMYFQSELAGRQGAAHAK